MKRKSLHYLWVYYTNVVSRSQNFLLEIRLRQTFSARRQILTYPHIKTNCKILSLCCKTAYTPILASVCVWWLRIFRHEFYSRIEHFKVHSPRNSLIYSTSQKKSTSDTKTLRKDITYQGRKFLYLLANILLLSSALCILGNMQEKTTTPSRTTCSCYRGIQP